MANSDTSNGDGNQPQGKLAMDNFSVAFVADTPVIKSVSLELNPGQSLCLVGSSGAGKSTAISSLLGLLPSMAHTSGSIVLPFGPRHTGFDSLDLQRYRRLSVGTVFQDPIGVLAPSKPILEQVATAFQFRHGVNAKDARELAKDTLNQVGLSLTPNLCKALPSELSGGMNQRVCIAIALSAPKIRLILADEPTSNLDCVMASQILELLLTIRENTNATCVFITHDVRLHRRFDRVAVLADGKIVENQSSEEFANSPLSSAGAALLAASKSLG